MKKAALMAAKKASKQFVGNIGHFGAELLPGLAGEFELKNGRRIMVESIGTSTEPKFFISVKPKKARPARSLLRIVMLTLGCIGSLMLINKAFAD
jgi:hypothetical protein